MGLFTAIVIYKSIKFVADKVDGYFYRRQCIQREKVENDNTIKIVVEHKNVPESTDDAEKKTDEKTTKNKKTK